MWGKMLLRISRLTVSTWVKNRRSLKLRGYIHVGFHKVMYSIIDLYAYLKKNIMLATNSGHNKKQLKKYVLTEDNMSSLCETAAQCCHIEVHTLVWPRWWSRASPLVLMSFAHMGPDFLYCLNPAWAPRLQILRQNLKDLTVKLKSWAHWCESAPSGWCGLHYFHERNCLAIRLMPSCKICALL